MRTINLFTFFVVITALKLHAQPYLNISSQLNFGSAYSSELPSKIIAVGDSMYVVGAITGDGGDITGVVPTGYNGVLLKTDANLNPAWHKVYGGDAMDGFTDIVLLSDGNLLIVGYTYDEVGTGDVANPSHGSADVWLLKISPMGQILWQRTYGGDGFEGLYTKIALSDNGNILIGTSSSSEISGNKTESLRGLSDYWVLCLNTSGNILWDKTIGSVDSNDFIAVDTDDSNNIYVGGTTLTGTSGDKTHFGYGATDFWLVKLSESGAIIWDVAFGGTDIDGLGSIKVSGSEMYLIGASKSPVSGIKTQPPYVANVYDCWLLKIDPENGNVIWDKVFGGLSYDAGYEVINIYNNCLSVISGSMSNMSTTKSENNYGLLDYWLIVIDANGIVLSDKTIGGADNDIPYSLTFANNSFYVAGRSRSQASGVKTSNTWNGGDDFWMVKIETNVGIPSEGNIHAGVDVFPNPVSETLFFTLEHNTYNARAEVLDVTGKIVLGELPAMDGRYGVNVNHLANGTYFLKISWQDRVAVKPFVKY